MYKFLRKILPQRKVVVAYGYPINIGVRRGYEKAFVDAAMVHLGDRTYYVKTWFGGFTVRDIRFSTGDVLNTIRSKWWKVLDASSMTALTAFSLYNSVSGGGSQWIGIGLFGVVRMIVASASVWNDHRMSLITNAKEAAENSAMKQLVTELNHANNRITALENNEPPYRDNSRVE